MSKVPFCEHHLFSILETYDKQSYPLDLFLHHYFRTHKALGSKDRGFISEKVYSLIRWRGLLEYLSPTLSSWEQRYCLFQEIDLDKIIHDQTIPLNVRVSFPSVLFHLLVADYGVEKAFDLCLISNTAAPTTIRVNRLKTTRDDLLEKWQQVYEISPTPISPDGIIFRKRINFFELDEFKQGFFEVQDEGSQLLAALVKAEPGQLVLDFCAGSAGKTLAFAPSMQNRGQIYVHDIRPYALQEAKKRLKRAGIQNAQILLPDSPHIKKLKKKMDWVLVDAPCTGTGTLRRNPDMKWRFDENTVPTLAGKQRIIFEKALSFMHPKGRIVYSTCSILKEENQQQLEHFKNVYDLEVEGDLFQSLPTKGGMDGFFGVVLKRKEAL